VETTLVLVSGSPRRRELLEERGFRLVVARPPEDVVELSTGVAWEVVVENAQRKVSAYLDQRCVPASENLNKVFIGVDTIVEYGGAILGKPSDRNDARSMLARLAGKTHRVYTAVRLVGPDGKGLSVWERTNVQFRGIEAGEIEHYLSTDEPFDKAGAYGIQGFAGLFIERIEGCYYNVVGLPLAALCRGLERLDVPLVDVLC